MTIHRKLAALLCAAVLTSCDAFEETAVQAIAGPTPTARIKFHNFSPSSVGVNFFANGVKMTAVSTTRCTAPVPADTAVCRSVGIETTTGTVYGGTANAGLYLGLAPGQYTLISKMAAKDTIVSTVTQAVADGKFYSFFMSGIYSTTTKTAEAFVVEDPIPTAAIDFSVAHVRFVNAVPNATGDMTLYATETTTLVESAVGAAVAYKAAGAFITLPEGTYNVASRYTGSATNVIARTALSFVGGRVYTITARGSTATASTLAFDFTSNQR